MDVFFILCIIQSCSQNSNEGDRSLVNLSHLNHLYEEVLLDSLPAAFIYIYADYPDYKPVEATGEGIACVDDVARAAIVYLRNYEVAKDSLSLERGRKLLQFLLDMQAENGMFYNFIFADHAINKTRENSQPKAEWWTWRALWALAEGMKTFRTIDSGFSAKMQKSINRIIPAVDSLLNNYPQKTLLEGFESPSWLPQKGGADQASILLLGLSSLTESGVQDNLKEKMRLLAEGLIMLQVGDSINFPFGLFRSWPDRWHAWGNSQAHSLLLASDYLNEIKLRNKALIEVQFFYPFVINRGFFSGIAFVNRNSFPDTTHISKFPQIAYDIRPMVLASLSAHDIIGDERFAQQAGKIACWLFGNNPAGALIYDSSTGRCFDGINDDDYVNKNSGAESTIEALLTLLEVEKNPIARQVVREYYQKRFE
jgi:hypothetical protein